MRGAGGIISLARTEGLHITRLLLLLFLLLCRSGVRAILGFAQGENAPKT